MHCFLSGKIMGYRFKHSLNICSQQQMEFLIFLLAPTRSLFRLLFCYALERKRRYLTIFHFIKSRFLHKLKYLWFIIHLHIPFKKLSISSTYSFVCAAIYPQCGYPFRITGFTFGRYFGNELFDSFRSKSFSPYSR